MRWTGQGKAFTPKESKGGKRTPARKLSTDSGNEAETLKSDQRKP